MIEPIKLKPNLQVTFTSSNFNVGGGEKGCIKNIVELISLY